MIAAISLIRRRRDLSLAAFRKHWLDPHGVLTARLPGARYYAQSHFIESGVGNEVAKSLAIDGMPQLWFDDYAARERAYTSAEIAACNVDSEQFIGAVTRLVTRPSDGARLPADARGCKAIVLTIGAPDPELAHRMSERAARLEDIIAFRGHEILEQAAAPQSRIPELALPVACLSEVSCRSETELRSVLEQLVADESRGKTAIFAAEDVRLI